MMLVFEQRVQRFIQSQAVDWFALIPGTNMLYFTGLDYHLGKRPILILFSASRTLALVPLLEAGKTREALPHAHLITWTDTEGYAHAMRELIAAAGLDRAGMLGVDGYTMRVFEYLALNAAGLPAERIRDVGRDLLLFRAIKTQDEIDAMQQAVRISELALDALRQWVRPGMTEKQIAQRLMEEQRQRGAHDVAFEPIVLVGPRSALPHGNPGDHTLQEDDILLIDFGCKVDHYPSDITRTFLLGQVSEQVKAMYDAVYAANAAARAVAAPGVTWGAVDKAARDVIEAAGFGPYFTHRTGHGLGLDGHELPQIASGEDAVLEPGMVFTIEPGIYIPGVGGVRIEDDMVVTTDGVFSLTSYPRERSS
ncbi:Xaa-Pro peptidase family protein [Aggregatilineales bacterium SYSU G02658]